jgi:hypothetical protein
MVGFLRGTAQHLILYLEKGRLKTSKPIFEAVKMPRPTFCSWVFHDWKIYIASDKYSLMCCQLCVSSK